MKLSDFEALVFEYADICFKIGRMETDDNTTQKAYDKLTDKRDCLRNQISEAFKFYKNYKPTELGWGKGKDE